MSLAQDGGNTASSVTQTSTGGPGSATTPTPTTPNKGTSAADSQRSTTAGDGTMVSSTATDAGSAKSHTDTPTPTPTSSGNSNDATQSFDSDYDLTGLAGSAIMMTPNLMVIPTPMFVIGSNVTLGWKYSNATLRPPNKVSICGKFPSGSNMSKNPASLCDWDIAVNISGKLLNYTWDTVRQGAPGVAFSEYKGYLMYLFDSDYGVNNPVPGPGRITPALFWFNLYNSRYSLTNQGVPSGYTPSAAHAVSVRLWAVAAIVALGALGVWV